MIKENSSDLLLNRPKKMLVSGPCSAESLEQLLTTALQLKNIGIVDYFRAGIWKPRTRPGGFEGAGIKALEWLKKVKEATGFKLTVEVATPNHIEECLKNDIDMLWIGARTSVNPFSVDEIARALKGVDIPVMIKNPVNPDINLWCGVIERISNAGIKKIYAVHRGFYTYEKSAFRNTPLWEIPIELKRRMPNLPVLCDPSHIAGNKELIASICQHAIDLDMDGFMIETHYKPENALTDAKQQITPEMLQFIWNALEFKSQFTEQKIKSEKLEVLRSEIDEIDYKILSMLANRMDVVKEIGRLKSQEKITILQIKRWNNIFEDRLKLGEKLGIDGEFLQKLLEALHQESIRIQSQNREG
jgi:chorismate mutase